MGGSVRCARGLCIVTARLFKSRYAATHNLLAGSSCRDDENDNFYYPKETRELSALLFILGWAQQAFGVVRQLRALPPMVLDGEFVVLDDKGRPLLDRLRRRFAMKQSVTIARTAVTDPTAISASIC